MGTHRPNKNANGMFVLPDAEMMADDTNGPTNDDVLPTCGIGYSRREDDDLGTSRTTENSAKNKNLAIA